MKHCQSGFSLTELLFAVLILGVGIAGLARGLTSSLSASKESEIQTKAALFAAGRMEFIRAEGYYIAGTEEGECGATLPGYAWEQTLTETDHEGLFQVEVKVLRELGSETSIYVLETLLFEPPSGLSSSADKENARTNDQSAARF
ncbi:prepilin-type N-terminal cleavage/methylation domain-containing protein [bacterium]|nr:prepilin-type N-terminal cleavage/methylation domain-containing protein [bacterium]